MTIRSNCLKENNRKPLPEDRFFQLLLPLFCIVFLLSCSDKNTYSELWLTQRYMAVSDSLKDRMIAAFPEDIGLCIFLRTDDGTGHLKKLNYRPGYPLSADSLVQTGKNEFYAPLLNNNYYVKDSVVLCIDHVKIFHPNSNLRGQTPWDQPYVISYNRLNK